MLLCFCGMKLKIRRFWASCHFLFPISFNVRFFPKTSFLISVWKPFSAKNFRGFRSQIFICLHVNQSVWWETFFSQFCYFPVKEHKVFIFYIKCNRGFMTDVFFVVSSFWLPQHVILSNHQKIISHYAVNRLRVLLILIWSSNAIAVKVIAVIINNIFISGRMSAILPP